MKIVQNVQHFYDVGISYNDLVIKFIVIIVILWKQFVTIVLVCCVHFTLHNML